VAAVRNSKTEQRLNQFPALIGIPNIENWVTMAKLPPPPRIAQNKSAFSFSLARILLPSAVTTSTEINAVHNRIAKPPSRKRVVPVTKSEA
jgi:hypothetical protein